MFFALLIVTFVVAFLTSALVARLFGSSIRSILDRIVSPELSSAWYRYLLFAIMVVGVSGGVRLYDLREFTRPRGPNESLAPLALTAERWTLEVYATIISTLQRVAVLLFVFFLISLFAYVVIRIFERIEARREMKDLRERREARDAASERNTRGERVREERSQARREQLVRRESVRRVSADEPQRSSRGEGDRDRVGSRGSNGGGRERSRSERPRHASPTDPVDDAGDRDVASESGESADSPARRRRRRTSRRERGGGSGSSERGEQRGSQEGGSEQPNGGTEPSPESGEE
ncbi:MAG TPA: hypothetical protein VKZ41_06930 [Gemmatimonadales bacterium]|nr:hypothetical protein [Gemmatimonadales bacterium]